MLVDIAERSLAESPFQDPTTAVQAIDRLHDCLRQLASRPFPDGRFHDEEGELRLTTRVMDWDAFVRLAFEEIRLVGAGSPQVSRRLQAALDDLEQVAPPERRAVLEEQRIAPRCERPGCRGPGHRRPHRPGSRPPRARRRRQLRPLVVSGYHPSIPGARVLVVGS